MFRLDVSHLQAPTITLTDALSTLGSHSVYMWITYLLELLDKKNLQENSTQHHRANIPNCNVTKASHSSTSSEYQRTI